MHKGQFRVIYSATPCCVIAQGEQAQIEAFAEALRESGPGLSVGRSA